MSISIAFPGAITYDIGINCIYLWSRSSRGPKITWFIEVHVFDPIFIQWWKKSSRKKMWKMSKMRCRGCHNHWEVWIQSNNLLYQKSSVHIIQISKNNEVSCNSFLLRGKHFLVFHEFMWKNQVNFAENSTFYVRRISGQQTNPKCKTV